MKLLDKTVVVDLAGRVIKPCNTYGEAVSFLRESGNLKSDVAGFESPLMSECYDLECDRAFFGFDKMLEHAEAMHTFSDIEQLVRETVREKYARRGDYKATPVIPSIWAWVTDIATDWVVFTVEQDTESTLYKASYSITDGAVTLGDPVEVKRRTVYEPVKKEES